ncbi:hypothetical protein HAN_3g410 (nucleomorph) [Hemiselmis andersenii]|uniref:Uncharacterized protein n=1 Tax=Hemiselmis andersenii TaxID=464988 RepID=A9BL37_HEMAN|nr:hypothetical protein HAN_3g410 [Hemiselmis andersenii]ABW98220.1 hypothetical protein HAN_3g410 [Hemiselmis andersenii]|mmetsp:Transcript_22096/g.51330  ORF Transcript_22096/g.51330 Transcript_22096/m.51330 type:complete len:135 (+) Transcript_22096:35-439(+)
MKIKPFKKIKTENSREFQIKIINDILNQIKEIKKKILQNKNMKFKEMILSFLNKKFFDLGLIKNSGSFMDEEFTINNFMERRALSIFLKKKLIKSKIEGKNLIKKRKLFSLGKSIKNPEIFLNHNFEKNVYIIN